MSDTNQYTNLLSGHFAGLEKFAQLIYELTQPYLEAAQVAASLPLAFDLDTAVGAQLDAVGERVGIGRRLNAPIEGVYFSLDTEGVGFDEGAWKGQYDPSDGVIELDDEFYRTVIRAKIAANSWDGTNETLSDLLNLVFNPSLGTYASFEDHQDMSMVVALSGKVPSPLLMQLLVKGYIDVKPAGVRISYYYTPSVDGPLFAFDIDNQYFSGFDQGVWATPHEGTNNGSK